MTDWTYRDAWNDRLHQLWNAAVPDGADQHWGDEDVQSRFAEWPGRHRSGSEEVVRLAHQRVHALGAAMDFVAQAFQANMQEIVHGFQQMADAFGVCGGDPVDIGRVPPACACRQNPLSRMRDLPGQCLRPILRDQRPAIRQRSTHRQYR